MAPAVKVGKEETEEITYIPNTGNRGTLRAGGSIPGKKPFYVDLVPGRKTVVPKWIADQLAYKIKRNQRGTTAPDGTDLEARVASGSRPGNLETGEFGNPVQELPKAYTIIFHNRG